MPTYLDYNATAPLMPQALKAMQDVLASPANASSVHRYGREAKRHLEQARKTIAGAISAWPQEVVFTASGTEANQTALRGFPARRVAVSAVEHSSAWKIAGATPHRLAVSGDGAVDLAALDAWLASDASPALVSVMLANNETGVIQPIREVSALCRKHQAVLHCDAVQALGKIPVDFGALGVDMMSLSAHKLGGPPGAAALVLRRDLPLVPLLAGGGQELGRRAGTENIAAINGFAAAVEHMDLTAMGRLRVWLEEMEAGIKAAGGRVLAEAAARLPNTSCVAMPGVSNEVQLMDFDLKGFAVSAGSACSSGRVEVSHVLIAMGLPKEEASCAIRISAGWGTAKEEVESFLAVWKATAKRLI